MDKEQAIKEMARERDKALYKVFYREWKKGNKFIVTKEEARTVRGRTRYTMTYKAYRKLPNDYEKAFKLGMAIYDLSSFTEETFKEKKAKIWG